MCDVPIPVGARIVSRKTFLKDSRARRTAEIEHDFVQDKDDCTGVSVFRLAFSCGAESGAYRQRPQDRDWLHQTGRTIALATRGDHVAPTKTVELALEPI